MKYEVCMSNTVRAIALQQSVDGQMDRRTDRQTDRVITIGLPHLRWRGPNNEKLIRTVQGYFSNPNILSHSFFILHALSILTERI